MAYRNQRMTEDQSVQGRRRIYYDPVGNETLIASDSEEEERDEEEPKHDFSKGEDYIIWYVRIDSFKCDNIEIWPSVQNPWQGCEAHVILLSLYICRY
jgi:hypothetical protein